MTLTHSPGPSWTVLPRSTPSASPSTRATSRLESDIDTDTVAEELLALDMGDSDTAGPSNAISKRKAPAEETGRSRVHKAARLDGEDRPGPSRGAVRASSGTSSTDFPTTLSQTVQKLVSKDKDKQARAKERERRERGQPSGDGVAATSSPSSSSAPLRTARKRTTQSKNLRKATTQNLMRGAQDSVPKDDSAAWTRTRPKRKPKRTTYDEEMASVRPLNVARERGGENVSDSSDSVRPRPAQASTSNAKPNDNDVIVITSDSEEERRNLEAQPLPRKKAAGARKRAPPPPDVEVISLSDSDEVAAPTSTAPSAMRPSQGASAAPASAPPKSTPAPTPLPKKTTPLARLRPTSISQSTPTSTLARMHEQPPPDPPSQRTEPPPQSSPAPPFGLPPNEFDDPFNEVEYDTALFNSYMNMEQVDGNMDQGTNSTHERVAVDAEAPAPARDKGPSTTADKNRAHVDGDGDGDVRMQSPGRGEPGPKDVAPASSVPGIQKSGNVSTSNSLEIRGEARAPSQLSPVKSPSQSGLIGRARTLVAVPDISSYQGVRYKRPILEERENPFFSRALSGARSTKPAIVGEARKRSSSDATVNVTAVPSSEREKRRVDGDTEIQGDTGASMPSSVVVSTPSLPAERPAKVPALPNSQMMPSIVLSAKAASSSPTRPVSSSTRGGPLGRLSSLPVLASAQLVSAPVQTIPAPVPPASVPRQTDPVTTQSAPAPIHPTPPSTQPAAPSTQPILPSTQPASLSTPPSATQPLSGSPSRPFIAPPRIPRPSAPISLVDALNEVRRLQSRRRINDIPATPDASDRFSQMAMLRPSLASQTFGGTPNLNELRTLLTKWNQSRPSSTATPARPPVSAAHVGTPTRVDMSHENGEEQVPDGSDVEFAHAPVPVEPVAARAPVEQVQVTLPPPAVHAHRSSDGEERPSEGPSTKSGTPPTTTTTRSGSGECEGAESSTSARRRTGSYLPFQAFISPLRTRKDVDKGKDADGGNDNDNGRARQIATSPTLLRSRASTGATRRADKATRSVRRESDSAAFEAYIVRDSPKRSGRTVERPTSLLEQPKFGGDGERAKLDAVVPERVSDEDLVPPVMLDSGEEGLTEDVNAMDVDEGQAGKGVDEDEDEASEEGEVVEKEGEVVAKPSLKKKRKADKEEGEVDEEEGEVDKENEGSEEKEKEDGQVDEADALLELASVHLSQTLAEAADELIGAPTTEDDDLPDDVSRDAADAAPEGLSVLADGDKVHLTEGTRATNITGISASHSTTPDLVLPDDKFMSRDHSAESIDECDAILAESKSEPEAVPTHSDTSSRTVSSTTLAPLRSGKSISRSPDGLAPVADSASIGGYRVITWASWVAEQRDCVPEYKLGKDLPHSLQDHMNALPEWFRNSSMGRQIFEAHIREASIGEPDAPPIEIFDNDIGHEATPAWEFHYTNELWFGEGVPPPDVKGLKSCGCVGRCDPKSGTCACAQRQLEWVKEYIESETIPPTWPGSPFVYDHRGQLQRLECPIFECNRFCSCDEDCPNRVVQNGRKLPVHISRTKRKGWGVIAGNKKIPKGSYLGIYSGELITEEEADARGKYYDLYGRTYLFSIDFHHLKFGLDNPDDWENLYVVDAYHAGNFTRFLNHSCDPNCTITACYIDDADVDKPLLAVFTIRDVEPWEELCFSYYGDIDEKREEIKAARENGRELVREHAVYAQCWCEAENCIGRLFG